MIYSYVKYKSGSTLKYLKIMVNSSTVSDNSKPEHKAV